MIRHIKYEDLDKVKWDRCVLQSENGFVYASSPFLDIMAGKWDALVLNDYEAVMPLPYRSKLGIRYIYPPAFSQQLGIISSADLPAETVDAFLDNIPACFRFIEANLNHKNKSIKYKTRKRRNFILNLDAPFEKIRMKFSRNAMRNIKKAEELKIELTDNISPREIIKIHRDRFQDTIGAASKDYEKFENLCDFFISRNASYVLSAKDPAGNIIAGSIFLIFKDRVTFILNGNSAKSMETGASHLLMNHAIRHFCGRRLTMDFEGSDFDRFVRFYENYGATPEYYPYIRINRLPWPLKLLKKDI